MTSETEETVKQLKWLDFAPLLVECPPLSHLLDFQPVGLSYQFNQTLGLACTRCSACMITGIIQPFSMTVILPKRTVMPICSG